jgi:hypothetical protein
MHFLLKPEHSSYPEFLFALTKYRRLFLEKTNISFPKRDLIAILLWIYL